MDSVYQSCTTLTPARAEGRVAKIRAKVRAYRRRDEIEDEIVRLKDHINLCYTKFIVCVAAGSFVLRVLKIPDRRSLQLELRVLRFVWSKRWSFGGLRIVSNWTASMS